MSNLISLAQKGLNHQPKSQIKYGALFYSPVDFTDASDLSTLMQVWCIGEINRWI